MLIVVAFAGVTGRPFLDAVRPLLPPSSSSSASPFLRNTLRALALRLAPSSLTPSCTLRLLWHSFASLHPFSRFFPCFSPPSCDACPLVTLCLPFPSSPPSFLCIASSLPPMRLSSAQRRPCFLPRGRLEAADTQLGTPHEAEACTVSWLEKPTCLECKGPAVPPPLSLDLQHRLCSQPSPNTGSASPRLLHLGRPLWPARLGTSHGTDPSEAGLGGHKSAPPHPPA